MNIFIDDVAAATDPDFASVLLLEKLEQSTPKDSSSYNRTLTAVGAVSYNTGAPKFGTWSASCNGNGGIRAATSTDWNFTGRVTFEFWLRPESATTGDFMGRRVAADNNNFFLFRFNSDGTLRFVVKTGGTQTIDFSSAIGNALALNTYHYVGFTRDDPTTPGTYNRWRIWANGSVIATQTATFSFPTATNPLTLGYGDDTGAAGFVGRVGGVRITSGVARDLSVVPTAQFPSS